MDAIDQIHKGILRKFHTLCSKLAMTDEEKHAIVESYGVTSSKELDTHDLINICNKLNQQLGGDAAILDKLRKSAMAAVGGYLRMTRQESNADIIKGIACRATGYSDFNKIPAERLRNIYYAFSNKQKDMSSVENIAVELAVQGLLNKQTSVMN